MFQPQNSAGVVPVIDGSSAASDAWRPVLELAAAFEQYIGQLRGILRLSSNEMNALLMLWQGGACSMTELSERIALSRPAVTTLIDRLEAAGYVTRAHDQRDRRQVLVGITERFEQDLDTHARAYRHRLRNHASASDTWGAFLDNAREVGQIASTSARELRDAGRLAPAASDA